MIRTLIALLFLCTQASAADYVLTRGDLPNNQQIIFQRTTGNFIYPTASDPNLAAYQAFLSGGGVPDRPIDPPRGLMVISTGTSSLSGAYNFTTQLKSDLLEVSIYALANNRFPGGFTQMPWRDAYGTVHAFTLAQWKTFVNALIDFDTAQRTGQSPTEPIVIP